MKLKNVSASQVKTYLACARKWHWEKIIGHRGPPTEAMARGTAIHFAIERYIKVGVVLEIVDVSKDTGKPLEGLSTDTDNLWSFRTDFYVEAAIPYIPERATAEHKLRLKTVGPPWLGFIDVEAWCLILDWKTTKNLRYAKTPEELREDPQAMSYAYSWLHDHPDEDLVTVKFVYLETAAKTKTRVVPVELEVTREQAETFWRNIQVTVEAMVRDADVSSTLDLPPTPSECDSYGGCPHKARCGLAGLQGLYNRGRTGKMAKNVQELINKKKADSIVPPDAPTPVVEPGDVAKATKKKVAKKRTGSAKKGPTVYINCAPFQDGDFVTFEEWIKPAIDIANEIAVGLGCQLWQQLGYSDEKIAFKTAVEKVLEEGLPKALVVNSRHPQAAEALAVILLHAPNVVRAFS